MALDTDKLRSHLKDSGLFSDAEIEAEVLSAQKDAKAEERRSILNTQKVEAPAVAESSPAIAAASPTAAAKAPSILSVPTAPAGTTPADIASGAVSPTGMGTPPETRVKKVGENVVDAGGDLVQNALDYFSTFPNYHPNITGAAAAVPIAYAAHKAAQATGLYDTLVSKMANSNATAQPQPFVGGSGPRVTSAPIQSWDIHSEPSFSNPAPAITPTVSPVATPSRNLTLEEAQARMAGVAPAAAPVVPPAIPATAPIAPTVRTEPPVPPVMSERQAAIAEANARLAAVQNSPEVQNSVWGSLSSNETPAEADARKSIGQAKLAAAKEAHSREMNAAFKLSEAPAIHEVGPPAFTGPRRPVVPTPPEALASTEAASTPSKTPAPSQRRNLAQIANNPVLISEQPEMRANYEKPKGINPETGKPFIGSGGYNWIAGQEGEKAPSTWKNLFGEKNVSYDEAMKRFREYELLGQEPGRGLNEIPRSAMGGSYPKPSVIPKYIKGAVSPSALASTAVLSALPALAVAGYQKYKGNEAAVNSSLQEAKDSLLSLATMPVDVAKSTLKGDFGPLKDLMMSMNPGSLLFNEMNKNDEAIIKQMIQKEKVGAGRGFIAPPTR
jgi:hypothetical protein